MKKPVILLILLIGGLLTACTAAPGGAALPTPMDAAYLPTAIALTLQAEGVTLSAGGEEAMNPPDQESEPTIAAASESLPEGEKITPTPLPTQTPTRTPTATPVPPTVTPARLAQPTTPYATQPPVIPTADIQIYRLGERSRVTSPIALSSFLTAPYGKTVTIELTGEDGRLLVREVRTLNNLPWTTATIAGKLEFEVMAAAELGRLAITAQDEHGRLLAVNSVNLILLSAGETDMNPSTATSQAIVIQQPALKSLIQGGKVIVSGLARPFSEQPLRIALVTASGAVVGQRVVGVGKRNEAGYGQFTVEVPYTVSALTEVLLTVYEDGGIISPIAHLTSLELMLSP